MSDEAIQKELIAHEKEMEAARRDIEAYTRKTLAPLWNKRREVVKKIPNFWGQAFGNTPLLSMNPSENDIEALENLTDFHVEYDDARPGYRKITATFNKNDVFKNETLTKEFIIDEDDEEEPNPQVLSKTEIQYHDGKAPSNKRKADEEDDFSASFLDAFANDDSGVAYLLSDEIFPSAIEYYQQDDEEDEDGDEEIELGSDSEEEEEEKPKSKKARK